MPQVTTEIVNEYNIERLIASGQIFPANNPSNYVSARVERCTNCRDVCNTLQPGSLTQPACQRCNVREMCTEEVRCSFCERSGQPGLTIPEFIGINTSYCYECARNIVNPCWSCGSSVVRSNDYQDRRVPNLYIDNISRLLLSLCEACNFIPEDACYSCFSISNSRQRVMVDGVQQHLCSGCINSSSMIACTDCSNYVSNRMGVWDSVSANYVCRPCANSNWVSCPSCTRIVERGQGTRFCDPCLEDDMRSIVLPHNANVLDYVMFGGDGVDKLYYGIEIELELNNSKKVNRSVMKEAVKTARLAIGKDGIVKWDGSLSLGIEIVSRPMTLDIQRKTDWQAKLAVIGENFHAAETCGLHIHVSRSSITDSALNRILTFVYATENSEFIRAIAGRGENRYTSFDSSGIGRNRYQAVNILNPATIEFRMFAGTSDFTRLFASLEFVDALVKFASARSRRLADMNVTGFVAWLSQAPQKQSYGILWNLLEGFQTPFPEIIGNAPIRLTRTVRMRHQQSPNLTSRAARTRSERLRLAQQIQRVSQQAIPDVPQYLGRDNEGNPRPTGISDILEAAQSPLASPEVLRMAERFQPREMATQAPRFRSIYRTRAVPSDFPF